MTIIVLAYAPHGQRWRLLAVGLLAFVVLLLPNRVSTAHQNEGNLAGDISRRATFVRNVEFAGRGHGAPASEAERARRPFSGEKAGLAEYLMGDHSVTVVAGGTLSGLYDSLSAAARRHQTKLVGALAFALCVLGFVYLLIVPRLRLLVLLPVLLAVPEFFFTSRDGVPAFEAGAAVWPSFVVAGGVLLYVLVQFAGRSSGGEAVRKAADRLLTTRVMSGIRLGSPSRSA